MIRFIVLLLLGCPFIASYNGTQLISTNEQTHVVDLEAERLPIPESLAVKKFSSDNSSTEGTASAFNSIQSLRETLLDTYMAEETDNSLLVQNELLSNYFGTRIDT
jgi:hypothetical protein